MTTQDDWSAELTRSIAWQVRRRRKAIGWSAKDLSDACYVLGHEIPRSTIADLENGRRRSVSIAEFLVLARALGASPVDLACPLELDGQVRVSPTELLASIEARQWWGGGPWEPEMIKDAMAGAVAPLLERIEQQDRDLRQVTEAASVTNGLIKAITELAKVPPADKLPGMQIEMLQRLARLRSSSPDAGLEALASLRATGIQVPSEAMRLLEEEPGPPVPCSNGHDVPADLRFCSECGIAMAT